MTLSSAQLSGESFAAEPRGWWKAKALELEAERDRAVSALRDLMQAFNGTDTCQCPRCSEARAVLEELA